MYCSTLQARNNVTKEVVAIKKMSYSGKGSTDVSTGVFMMFLPFCISLSFSQSVTFSHKICLYVCIEDRVMRDWSAVSAGDKCKIDLL